MDNDGPFINQLMNALTNASAMIEAPLATEELDVTSSDDTTTGYGGDQFFNLTNEVFGVIGTTDYFRYSGSLTTPTCAEGINWFNMANPMFISSRQLVAFTSMLAKEQGGNSRGADNRLIQPINGRPIYSSIPPPPPTLVSGELQFDTTLNAASFGAMEANFTAALAGELGVPVSAIDITAYTNVPAASGQANAFDVSVAYTVTVSSLAAATAVSGLIAAGTMIPSGLNQEATLVAALPASLGVTNIVPVQPTVSLSVDPSTAYNIMTTSNTLLANSVANLTAGIALSQTASMAALTTSVAGLATSASLSNALANITAQLAALQTAVAASKRTPGTAPAPGTTPGPAPAVLTDGNPIYITVTHTLLGYTSATFGSAQAAQFKAILASELGVAVGVISITSVTDVPASGRRHVLQTAGVNVASSILTTQGASGAISATLASSTLSAATLQAGGLSSCTGIAVSVQPGTAAYVAGAPTPPDVVAALPQTAAEPSSVATPAAPASTNASSSKLNGLLALLVLPVAALLIGVWHVSRRNAARHAAARAANSKMSFLDEAAQPQQQQQQPVAYAMQA
jgi:hypothetical protein